MRVYVKLFSAAVALIAALAAFSFIEKIDAEEVVESIEVAEVAQTAEIAEAAEIAQSAGSPEIAKAENAKAENAAEMPELRQITPEDAPAAEYIPMREKSYSPIDLTADKQDAARQKAEGWSWDAEKATLTLDGVNIETLGTSVILPNGEVTIIVKGDNFIMSRGASKASICCIEGAAKNKAALTLKGGGALILNPSNTKGNSAGIAVDTLTTALDTLEINCKSYSNHTVSGIYALNSIKITKGSTGINYTGKAGGVFCGASAYTGGFSLDKNAEIVIKASGSRDTVSGIAARDITLNGSASVAAKCGGYLTALYADENVRLGKGSKCAVRLESKNDRALAVLALSGGAELCGTLQTNVTASVEAGGVYAKVVKLASSTSLITSLVAASEKAPATATNIEGAFGIKSKTSITAESAKLEVNAQGKGSSALVASTGFSFTRGEAVLFGGDCALSGEKADTALKAANANLSASSDGRAANVKGSVLLTNAAITEGGGGKSRIDGNAKLLVIEPAKDKPASANRTGKSEKEKKTPEATPAPTATPKPSALRFGR